MLVDGKAIAANILQSIEKEISTLSISPKMTAITCAPNFETQKYLDMKKRKAASVGVALNVVELPANVSTEDVLFCIEKVAKESDGIVVQLPLPVHIDRECVLAAVPHDKDPDGFSYGKVADACLPPVAGAIDEISKIHKIDWRGKNVVVLGGGRLVGLPAAEYADQAGASVIVLTKENYDEAILMTADIVISGIGQPHFIKPEMVKEGVVLFDAGTSEDGGVLVGDVDPTVEKKAELITPVPGGIGPITIAYLLRNLVRLAHKVKTQNT